MKKLRVLLIHQAFIDTKEPGGTRHYEFARHFVDQGGDFTIVASNLSYFTGRSVVDGGGLVTEQNVDGVRVLRVYTYPALHKSYIWRVVSFLSFMVTAVWGGLRAGPVDVVMGTSPPIFQAVSSCLVAALRRRPFLFEVRDLWPEFAVDIGLLKNPALIRFARRLERFLYRRATHIVVNSPAYRDYLIKKGVPARKISFISNGVDPSMFDPEAKGEGIRQEFNLGDKFVAVYAGALGMANDIPTIINAAAHLRDEPNIQILLVGDGKERAKLEAQVKELKLTNVTFTGSRPKSDMKEILAAADAGIATLRDIPMFRTTYPNKVFDYMAAGRPTVLGIDGVIRQVIDDAQGGVFVPPGDDVALAEALRNLSQNPDTCKAMGERAREHVVKYFNRNQQAQQFIDLLNQMAKRRGRKK